MIWKLNAERYCLVNSGLVNDDKGIHWKVKSWSLVPSNSSHSTMFTVSTWKYWTGRKIAKWDPANTCITTENWFSLNSLKSSRILGFVKTSKFSFFNVSFAIRFISSGYDKFLFSDFARMPADFWTKLRAAENKMFGSFSLSVVPKSLYMPICFESDFLPLVMNTSSDEWLIE